LGGKGKKRVGVKKKSLSKKAAVTIRNSMVSRGFKEGGDKINRGKKNDKTSKT